MAAQAAGGIHRPLFPLWPRVRSTSGLRKTHAPDRKCRRPSRPPRAAVPWTGCNTFRQTPPSVARSTNHPGPRSAAERAAPASRRAAASTGTSHSGRRHQRRLRQQPREADSILIAAWPRGGITGCSGLAQNRAAARPPAAARTSSSLRPPCPELDFQFLTPLTDGGISIEALSALLGDRALFGLDGVARLDNDQQFDHGHFGKIADVRHFDFNQAHWDQPWPGQF